MLFNAEAFEQYFSERDLRKGYLLHEKGAVSVLTRNNTLEQRYHIGPEEGVLRKRSSNILNWNCSCGRNYCQHLAALMFHLHQTTLDTRQGARKTKKDTPSGLLHTESKLFSSGLQKLDKFRKSVRPVISQRTKSPVIDAVQAVALKEDLRALFTAQLSVSRGDDSFYFSLAIIREMIPVCVKFDHSAMEEINPLMDECYNRLDVYYRKELDAEQTIAWKQVTNDALKNNRALYSSAFKFLVPRTLLLPPEIEELRELRQQLGKRKYLLKNTVDFDPVTIARYQLQIIQKGELFSDESKCTDKEPEYFIALVQLFLVAKRRRDAFSVLQQGLRHMDKGSIQYQEYLEYALSLARQYAMSGLEQQFLKEIFVFGLFIRPGELNRYMQLAGDEASSALIKLQKEIRASDPYYFDKMSLLLTAGGRYDELITLISKQSERFMLLHDVVMKKGGIPDHKLIMLYRDQMLSVLRKTDNPAMHEKIINRSLQFFKCIPYSRRVELCEDLLLQIGRNKPVYGYLENAFQATNLPA